MSTMIVAAAVADASATNISNRHSATINFTRIRSKQDARQSEGNFSFTGTFHFLKKKSRISNTSWDKLQI